MQNAFHGAASLGNNAFLYAIFLVALTASIFVPAGAPALHLITALIFSTALIALLSVGGIYVKHNYIVVISFVVTLGLALVWYSLIIDPTNAYFSGIRIYVVNVVVYATIALVISSLRFGARLLEDTIYIASALVSITILAFVFSRLAGWAFPLDFLPLDYKFGLAESGFFAYSTNNLPVLFFTVPFMLAHLTVAENALGTDRKRKAVLFVSVLAGIMSFRLAFILALALSVSVLYLFFWNIRARIKATVLLSVIAAALVAVLAVVLPVEILETFLRLKLLSKMDGSDPRYLQVLEWGNLIRESPLMGHGVGSIFVSGGRIINDYGYELTYHMLIAEIGILPIAAYVFLLLVVVIKLLKKGGRGGSLCRHGMAISLVLGLICFLVANATNGYLLTFGRMWPIFFPLAFLQWRSNFSTYRLIPVGGCHHQRRN